MYKSMEMILQIFIYRQIYYNPLVIKWTYLLLFTFQMKISVTSSKSLVFNTLADGVRKRS